MSTRMYLTIRDFLKLSTLIGGFAILLMVSQTPNPNPKTSYAYVEYVPLVEVGVTDYANVIEVGDWAVNKESGLIDLEVMYQIVGAIRYEHHKSVDLQYDGIDIAAVTDEDISSLNKYQQNRKKKEIAQQLNQVNNLQSQLLTIKQQFQDSSSIYVVIKNNTISYINVVEENQHVFYKFDNKGNLRQLSEDEEPLLLPRLQTDGAYLKRADTGEIVSLKGVDVVAFASDRSAGFQTVLLAGLSAIIEQKWKINYLEIYLDSLWMAGEKLNDLDELIELAEQNGMYVQLIVSQTNGVVYPSGLDDSMIQLLSTLANRYKHKNHVLYGGPVEGYVDTLTPEERINAWQVWIEKNTNAGEAIRRENPNALFSVYV